MARGSKEQVRRGSCSTLLGTSAVDDCVHRHDLSFSAIFPASVTNAYGPFCSSVTKISAYFSVARWDGFLPFVWGRGRIVSSTALFTFHPAPSNYPLSRPPWLCSTGSKTTGTSTFANANGVVPSFPSVVFIRQLCTVFPFRVCFEGVSAFHVSYVPVHPLVGWFVWKRGMQRRVRGTR